MIEVGSGNDGWMALADIREELQSARAKHPRGLCSAHEAIAVIREEYLEAEREVFARHLDKGALYAELVQVAAMAVRAIEDLNLMPPTVVLDGNV